MPHQPFPIADMSSGMYQAKEPWLSPINAFANMNDAYVFRSRIHRRKGFDRFSSCGVSSISAYTKNLSVGTVKYTLSDVTAKFTPESVDFTWDDPVNGIINAHVPNTQFGYLGPFLNAYGWIVVDSTNDVQIGVISQFGSVVASRAIIDWSLHSQYTGEDVATPLGTMTFKEDPELPIVGIDSYKSTDGTEYLIAINTTRLFAYNSTRGYFDDLLGVNTFTGTATDLFWTWPLEDDLLITNGIDRVKKYNGAGLTLTNMGTTLGAGPNVVDSAKLVIFYRNRVIYLNTSEGGSSYPRRSRWSRAGAYETLDVEDFSDAPTEMGAAVTVQFIADRIMVGFQKGWMELVYTRDPQSLFEWQKTTSIYGATARLGSIADGERILSRSENGIEALDPNQQYAADVDIPDFVVDQMDTANAGVTFGIRNIPGKQLWWTMVSAVASSGSPDEMLVGQYEEDKKLAWSRYKIPFNCFAEYRSETSENWDDIDKNWDDYDGIWDGASNLTGFPLMLSGHSNGLIYKSDSAFDYLGDGLASVQSSIPFSISSERLSPFPGQSSHFGWVDFYIETSTGVTITVEFRGNSRTAAYKTASFSLTPTGSNEKIYRRLFVNKTATFHSMVISASGGGAFAIDAIIPWFRPAGRMRNFG